jgi:quercetin dioxygenase-like cupin family protein
LGTKTAPGRRAAAAATHTTDEEAAVRTWDLTSIDVEAGQPEVLHSVPQGRAIAINLPAGTALDDHEVHEAAWLIVASGKVRVASEKDEAADHIGAGGFIVFDPRERHDVSAEEDSRLLLLLTPWPAPDRRMDGAE